VITDASGRRGHEGVEPRLGSPADRKAHDKRERLGVLGHLDSWRQGQEHLVPVTTSAIDPTSDQLRHPAAAGNEPAKEDQGF
jgi:hypothetical protein